MPPLILRSPQMKHFLPTPKDRTTLSSTWENLAPLTPNIAFVACSLISVGVWAALMMRDGGVASWTLGNDASYSVSLFFLFVNCVTIASPIYDAIFGFGPEVNRTFQEYCTTKQGQEVLDLWTEEQLKYATTEVVMVSSA